MADAKLLGANFGRFLAPAASPNAFSSITIDASTDRAEWLCQAEAADTITHLGFRYTLRTGTPVEHKISLQGITSGGVPDGTVLGGASPASGLFTPPADATWDGTWQWIALDNSIALTQGQQVAIVIEPTGTPSGANSAAFTLTQDTMSSARHGFPIAINNNAGARTRLAAAPVYGMKSATRTYGWPAETLNFVSYSSDSTPDERAFAFTLPTGHGDTFKVAGVRLIHRSTGASKSIVMTLYEGTTAKSGALTFDCDNFSTINVCRVSELYFTDLPTLSYGTLYRIGFAPQETAANFALATVQVDVSGDMSAWPGGTDGYLSTRTDAGAWTDDLTQRPVIELILADITEPAAGGGGLARIIGG